jgi:hypothetical protein
MNESTALTVAEQEAQTALAQLDPAALMPAGIERLENGDTGMPPRLRISQPNRPIKIGDEKIEPGLIVNTLTGQTWTDLDVVVLVFLDKTRVMWPVNFDTNNDPECLSNDGKVPAQPLDMRPMTNPQTGPCDECPWAQFGEDAPPRCKKQRNFLVWLVEQKEPAILTMQSTALKSARHLTTLARTKGLRSSVIFTTTSVEDNRGSWVIPAFTAGRRLTASEILELVEVRGELQNLVVGADVEAAEVEETPEPVEAEEMPF